MDDFTQLNEKTHRVFDAHNQARDRALLQARQLTRFCALAIRAIHRSDHEAARQNLDEAARLVADLKTSLADLPTVYYAGYTQDAIKEFVEASNTVAIIQNRPLILPEELGVEYATYLNGLAEVTGELRRRCLDILRQGYSDEAERLLGRMDDIYELLITIDYPDAITNGLRRQTDLVRGIVERTRGDLTVSLREQRLHAAMQDLAGRLASRQDADDPRL